jgi:hypothetical protein
MAGSEFPNLPLLLPLHLPLSRLCRTSQGILKSSPLPRIVPNEVLTPNYFQWVAVAGYTCMDAFTGNLKTKSACNFGPEYSISDTFTQIPNAYFNVGYISTITSLKYSVLQSNHVLHQLGS